MNAAGQMTTRTPGTLESLRKAARGGHAWLIALGCKLLDEAMDKRAAAEQSINPDSCG